MMKTNLNVELECRAGAGQLLNDAIRDGVVLAFAQELTAYVTHNDRRFKIDPREIIERIAAKYDIPAPGTMGVLA